MKFLNVTLIIAAIFNIDIQVGTSTESFDFRHHLSYRTPYRFVSNKNSSRIKYPNCKDSKIWMIVRHGTRFPSSKDITAAQNLKGLKDEIVLQHDGGQGELTKKQLKQLKDWTINITLDKEMLLTLEGQDEMILLAERMQKRFPNAIKQKYNNKTFLFRYTTTQRTQQSARYFTVGLFSKKDAQRVEFAPATKIDKVLRV